MLFYSTTQYISFSCFSDDYANASLVYDVITIQSPIPFIPHGRARPSASSETVGRGVVTVIRVITFLCTLQLVLSTFSDAQIYVP